MWCFVIPEYAWNPNCHSLAEPCQWSLSTYCCNFFFEHKIAVFPQGSKNKIKIKDCDSRAINWNIQVNESYSEFPIKGVLHTEVLVVKEFVTLVFDSSLLLLFTTLKGASTERLNSHFLMKKQSDAYSQFTPAGWHCQKMSILRSTSWLKMTYQVQT